MGVHRACRAQSAGPALPAPTLPVHGCAAFLGSYLCAKPLSWLCDAREPPQSVQDTTARTTCSISGEPLRPCKLNGLTQAHAAHLCHIGAAGMEEAHRTGSPLARPLWWRWPADPLAHNASGQWLLGNGVLVSPVLEKGADQVSFVMSRHGQ